MEKELKELESVSFVKAEGVIFGLPPYMLAKNWAALVGKTERAVKKDLQTGVIARYQPVPNGLVMVNVTKEIQKAELAPDW
ncbi:hypothetical protein CBF23_003295 [Marinomonas agarivorans]|nr:hypothetical protein CBF23_003295 [Marinomonas agarivorans]